MKAPRSCAGRAGRGGGRHRHPKRYGSGAPTQRVVRENVPPTRARGGHGRIAGGIERFCQASLSPCHSRPHTVTLSLTLTAIPHTHAGAHPSIQVHLSRLSVTSPDPILLPPWLQVVSPTAVPRRPRRHTYYATFTTHYGHSLV